MRSVIALLLACAASPPRPATEVAVGSDEWNRVDLAEWSIELPAAALSDVQVSWEEGERRATLSLTGAPIGSSVERMADDEERAMRSLDDAEIERRRLRIADVGAILLHQGQRDVVVAMRNPWRALRLAIWGASADDWMGTDASIAGVSLAPRWALHDARFESHAYALTITRDGARGEPIVEREGWRVWLREKTGAPEDIERLRESFAVRSSPDL